LEVHAGEGGDDSKIFVQQLFDAYQRCARKRNLTFEWLDDGDGYAEAAILGAGAQHFRQEAGGHCVQRIPPTERNGRRQTSMVSVAVLPLQEHPPQLNLADVEITAQRGHGRGGQNQNKVASACRVIHRLSGLMVFVNGRDFHRNKARALQVLAERLEARHHQAHNARENAMRQQQIGYGGRGNKIRTYNFFHDLAVDHRTGHKVHNLQSVMAGDIDLLWES